MRKKTILKYVLAVLTVFIGLQFLSQVLLKWGQGQDQGKRAGWFRAAALLMPLDAEPAFEYGYTLLQENLQSRDNDRIRRSIVNLKRAVGRNRLHYFAYFYLGKAYILHNYPRSEYFLEALDAFRRAAFLRWKNPLIGVETMKYVFSMWALLQQEDRAFYRRVLKKMVTLLSKDDFNVILEYWSLYSRDIGLFKDVLREAPKYFKAAADELARLEIHLKARHLWLAEYEKFVLDSFTQHARRFARENSRRPEDWLWTFSHLNQGVLGYYKLVEKSRFPEEAFVALRRQLNLKILELLLARRTGFADEKWTAEFEKYVSKYLRDFSAPSEVKSLYKLLQAHRFFAAPDLKRRILELRIILKMGDLRRLIREAETLKGSFSFIRKDQVTDYVKIVLMLAEACSRQGLFDRARTVLTEAMAISPRSVDLYWQMMKLEAPGDGDEARREMYGRIRASRVIELSAPPVQRTVYLVDGEGIEIHMGAGLGKKWADKHLLQVFLDGRIAYEQYVSRIQQGGVKIDAGVDATVGERFRRVEVEIRII